ncbi:hypothetical protein OF83DRAFT_1167243 [Amylostereum chailletii]|nr:hypothetical protein OF83DRAFT_1167243 [Amylostereum chailletii]
MAIEVVGTCSPQWESRQRGFVPPSQLQPSIRRGSSPVREAASNSAQAPSSSSMPLPPARPPISNHGSAHNRTSSFFSIFRSTDQAPSVAPHPTPNAPDEHGRMPSSPPPTQSPPPQSPPTDRTDRRPTSSGSQAPGPAPSSGQPIPGQLHPEIRSVVQLTLAHAHKVYFSGPLVRRIERLPDGHQPAKDEGWRSVWAQLGGTTLSVWDTLEIEEANKHGKEVPPTYINITDAFVQVLGAVTIPASGNRPPQRYSNVVTVNTAGSNLLLFSCPSGPELIAWASAFRLASWEKSRLEEIYTAHLLRITLNDGRDTPTTLVRGKMEGWVRVRLAGQTDWKRLWMVVSSGSTEPYVPPAHEGRPGPAEITRKRRISSLWGGAGGSRDEGYGAPLGKSQVSFFSSAKTRDRKKAYLSFHDVSQAFAVYPERPELINRSTLMKLEGTLGDEEIAGTMRGREGWILVMPELEPGFSQAREMLKWLIAIHDAFQLYGRPKEYIWDPRNSSSLMFAYPIGPNRDALFLEREAAETMDPREDRTSAVRSRLFNILTERMQSQGILPRGPKVSSPPTLPPLPMEESPTEASPPDKPPSLPQLPPLSFGASQDESSSNSKAVLTPITEMSNSNPGSAEQSRPRSTGIGGGSGVRSPLLSGNGPSTILEESSSTNFLDEPTLSNSPVEMSLPESSAARPTSTELAQNDASSRPASRFSHTYSGSISQTKGSTDESEARPLVAPSATSFRTSSSTFATSPQPVSRSTSANPPPSFKGSMFPRESSPGFSVVSSGYSALASDDSPPLGLASPRAQPTPPLPRSPAPPSRFSTTTPPPPPKPAKSVQSPRIGSQVSLERTATPPTALSNPASRPTSPPSNPPASPFQQPPPSSFQQPPPPSSFQPSTRPISVDYSVMTSPYSPVGGPDDPSPFGDHGRAQPPGRGPRSIHSSSRLSMVSSPPEPPLPSSPLPPAPRVASPPRPSQASTTSPRMAQAQTPARAPVQAAPLPPRMRQTLESEESNPNLYDEGALYYMQHFDQSPPAPRRMPTKVPEVNEEDEEEDESSSEYSVPSPEQSKVGPLRARGARSPPAVGGSKSGSGRMRSPTVESGPRNGPQGLDRRPTGARARPSSSSAASNSHHHHSTQNYTQNASTSRHDEDDMDDTADAIAAMNFLDREERGSPSPPPASSASRPGQPPQPTIVEPEDGTSTPPSDNASQYRSSFAPSKNAMQRKAKTEAQQAAHEAAVTRPGRANGKGKAKAKKAGAWGDSSEEEEEEEDDEDVDSDGEPTAPPSVRDGSTSGHMQAGPQGRSPYNPARVPSPLAADGSSSADNTRNTRHLPQVPGQRPPGPYGDPDYAYSPMPPRSMADQYSSAPRSMYDDGMHAQQNFQTHAPVPAPPRNIFNQVLDPNRAPGAPPPEAPSRDTFIQLESPAQTMTKAFTPHGLLSVGLQDKQDRSAKKQEELARESGASLINVPNKPPPPQTGLLGAITAHERERKREGGVGATLTEREREKRVAEDRQRKLDEFQRQQLEHMAQGGSMYGGQFGGYNPMMMGMNPMMTGMNPMMTGMMGYPGMMNPQHMFAAQQAAQQAYQQAMMNFSQAGSQVGGERGVSPGPMNPMMTGPSMGGQMHPMMTGGSFDPRMSMMGMPMMGMGGMGMQGMGMGMGGQGMVPMGMQMTGGSGFDPRFSQMDPSMMAPPNPGFANDSRGGTGQNSPAMRPLDMGDDQRGSGNNSPRPPPQ